MRIWHLYTFGGLKPICRLHCGKEATWAAIKQSVAELRHKKVAGNVVVPIRAGGEKIFIFIIQYYFDDKNEDRKNALLYNDSSTFRLGLKEVFRREEIDTFDVWLLCPSHEVILFHELHPFYS